MVKNLRRVWKNKKSEKIYLQDEYLHENLKKIYRKESTMKKMQIIDLDIQFGMDLAAIVTRPAGECALRPSQPHISASTLTGSQV